jgi:hypothetical protein
MAMACNIKQRGRVLRLLVGFILFFTGTLMFVTSVPAETAYWRAFDLALAALGVFMMFEGIMGWCALRAMGFKTKL